MIERVSRGDKSYIIGYHTQEFRSMEQALAVPIMCKTSDAWLGYGYYFWVHLEFAHYWGKDRKKRTGQYDIYSAEIDEENMINACFDEQGYFFFKKSIEDAIEMFKSKGLKITLSEVQRYLVEKFWPTVGVTGIIYDDLPQKIQAPGRIYSVIPPLYYKKRIQIAVFNVKNIVNFEIKLEAQNC